MKRRRNFSNRSRRLHRVRQGGADGEGADKTTGRAVPRHLPGRPTPRRMPPSGRPFRRQHRQKAGKNVKPKIFQKKFMKQFTTQPFTSVPFHSGWREVYVPRCFRQSTCNAVRQGPITLMIFSEILQRRLQFSNGFYNGGFRKLYNGASEFSNASLIPSVRCGNNFPTQTVNFPTDFTTGVSRFYNGFYNGK